MSKQSIYLDDHFEEKVRAIAQREGRSVSDVIRKRVEWSFKYERKELSLKKLENQMNAMYSVIEILADELAFLAGAAKENIKSNKDVVKAGVENTAKIQTMVNFLRKTLIDHNTSFE